MPLLSRLVPHFGEDIEDLPQTLFEVAPTLLATVPRYLQKFASQVLLGLLNSTGVKRRDARGIASCSGNMPVNSSTARTLCKRAPGRRYSAAATTRARDASSWSSWRRQPLPMRASSSAARPGLAWASQRLGVTPFINAVGTIATKGILSGSTLTIQNSATVSGALLVKTSITSKGSLSGSTIAGFNLGSCNGSTKKLLYNYATQKFECGTDNNAGTFGTGNVLTIGDARYLKRSGGTMTGQLVVDITGGGLGTIGLKVINTISGAIIHAEKTLTSSGNLVVNGNALLKSRLDVTGSISGSALEVLGTASGKNLFATQSISGTHLFIASTIGGAGLATCNGTTSKLLYNAATKQFACENDETGGGGSAFGTGNVITIGDSRYVNTSGDAMTGALTININGTGSAVCAARTHDVE